MTAFLIWIGLIFIGLAGYSILLWRRAQGRFRFQARLTILFFLFVLIPAVPLTLSLSFLITKSTEMFMLPDVERALAQSLEMMRSQLAQQGEQFHQNHPDIRTVHVAELQKEGMSYAGQISWLKGKPVIQHFVSADQNLNRTIDDFTTEDFRSIRVGERKNALITWNAVNLFESYKLVNDSTCNFVGFRLPDSVAKSKEYIAWALRNYASLSLLQETFISQGLIWAIAVLFIIVLVIITVYSAKTISKGISEPIRQLSDGMKRIGSGDLSHRVDAKAKDEIAFLVDSFNNMASQLKASRENLQRAERAAAWRDVARQVSHEIKNPLTPIQFSLYRLKSTLSQKQLENADIKESFRIIEDEINSMRRIATEFSDFARMPHLELKPENIREIIKSSARLFEGEIHKVSINLNLDDDVPLIQLDKEQFRRVMHNLLKNAMEASSPGDRVDVNLVNTAKEKPQVRIEIIDHGCGMDDETLAKAFRPYFTTKEKGSGLGLFIVNRIIADHGGELNVKSEKNKGTFVTIFL